MKEFKASDVKFLAAKEAGFSKTKVIFIKASDEDTLCIYMR